jgi:hypothetical protein
MSYQRAITPRSVTWGRRLSFGRLTFTACSDRMLEGVRDLASWRVIPNAVDTTRYRFAPAVAAEAGDGTEGGTAVDAQLPRLLQQPLVGEDAVVAALLRHIELEVDALHARPPSARWIC